MLGMWQQMDAVLGGTETMRMAGKKYMPPHTGEETGRYKERLETATLWNQTELTLNGWVGRPFRKPLKLNEDVPEEIKKLEQDIDQQGTNMDTFARSWFKTGIAKAFCHVLIDFKGSEEREDGAPLTLKDTNAQDMRPYWILIEPDSVMAARSTIVNGKELLEHLRIHEMTTEVDPDDPFSEIIVERIRVYDRVEDEAGKGHVYVSVYKRDEDAGAVDSAEGWPIEIDPFEIDIDIIPMVTFYADRQGFLLGKSPLQDLCDLNVKHWQSQSDQDSILRIARFPILAGSGVDSVDDTDPIDGSVQSSRDFNNGDEGTVIGPFKVLLSSENGGKFYYVEHTGKAIGVGRDSLKDLEAHMAAYGSEFLKKSPDRQTATARAMDSAESTSPLQAAVLTFIDAVQTALAVTARWLEIEPEGDATEWSGGTIELITDFGPEEVSAIDYNALVMARQGRDISQDVFLSELKRRGTLAEGFDPEKNKADLQKEALDMAATALPGSNTDLDPEDDEDDEDDGEGEKEEKNVDEDKEE
jgi:hypothetical protein